MGALASSPSLDSNTVGRKRPVLRAKLACIFCRRRKIQVQCAKRGRKCEYPKMTWRGRGRRPTHDLNESDYE
ncbi:hypothetical protein BGY98DRAFT_1022788 [Russula aff. rugulosa BPL654]|nr:hypothetical protein BGY98DRAFT_1022788 [Russula aff. rugulosa BPL654]